MYEQVFALHEISRKDYYRSFRFYQTRPDLQKEVFDSLISVLKKKETIKKEPGRKGVHNDTLVQ
jgi:hypothetical protein